MKIQILAKTGKGEESTEKEIDETVDTVLDMGSMLEKKFKDYKLTDCRNYNDSTSVFLEK